MLGSLTYAIIEEPALGWGAPAILALFALAAASLVAFAGYEARRVEPVLDPKFFRSAPFAGSVLAAITAFAAMGGFLFLATLYLQDARGESALRAGLHIMPMAIIMAPGAVVSSRILARRGARLPMLASGLGMAAGGVLLSRLTIASPTWPIVLAFCVFGIGASMVNPPITYAAVSGMPTTQAGVASSIASARRQVGQSLGVAITAHPGREPPREPQG